MQCTVSMNPVILQYHAYGGAVQICKIPLTLIKAVFILLIKLTYNDKLNSQQITGP